MNGSSDSTGLLADQIGNRKTNILKGKLPHHRNPSPATNLFFDSFCPTCVRLAIVNRTSLQTTQMENIQPPRDGEKKKKDVTS